VILALLSLLALGGWQQADTGRAPAIVTRAPIDTSAPVNFRVLASPETVYVGQQATYELGVFLDASVRDRMRRMEAIAPEMRGMMAYEPPAPLSGFPTRIVGQHRYEAHVYQRAVFPLAAGRLAIPPARLVYAMPLTYSFFSHEETYELRSDSAIVVAIEPPLAGRPADWTGAVGTLRIASRVDSTIGRVGNPILLTVSVAGRGNVSLFPRPTIAIPWASAVPTVDRVRLSPDSLDIRGVKEFDWVLTPERAGRVSVPEIHYSYFDPEARRYEMADAGATPMMIGAGTLASGDTGVSQPPLALRATYRGSLAPAPYQRAPFWWVVLMSPVPALGVAIARRPRRVRRPTPARALLALTRAPHAPPVRELRRVFLAAVVARIRPRAVASGLGPGSLAEPGVLARAARRAGVSLPTASAAGALMDELNAAAFSSGGSAPSDIAQRAERVYRAIDREACRPRVPIAAALLVVLAVGAGAAGVVRAASPNDAAAVFARGVDAYQHHQFVAAERDFADITRRVPRAADAWANYGTAAFVAADTAGAALGWQRALRLEPLASDARDRLELLGAASGTGAVPTIPPTPLALLAAALWLAGWGALAWRTGGRRPVRVWSLATLALGAAAILATVSASIDSRLAARDLVVVSHDAELHDLPALGSDHTATVRTGEVARVMDRHGPWARIATDGGRLGWTVASDLSSLARD
jgi:hypothetical protein